MALFETILVPFDLSPAAEQSVRFGRRLADRFGAALHVVHGLKLPYYLGRHPQMGPAQAVDDVRAHVVARMRGVLEAMGVTAVQQVGERPIEEWIDDYAASQKAPLIVMSRHGWRALSRGLGPHARLILRNSRVPVWLTARDVRDVNRVVAAVDLSGHSAPLAAYAKNVARAFGAPLTLVHARPPVHETGYLQEVAWHDPLPDPAAMYAEERAALAALAAATAEPDFPVATQFLLGRTDEAIGAELLKTETELLVCGKHNRGALVRFLVGSTTEQLAGETDGHVLVVP